MESLTTILIYIHAAFGGLALLVGLVAIASKKGNSWHKRSGLVFYYGMLASAITALVISVWPKHENAFLFSIGLFSTYLLLVGYQGLQYKNQLVSLLWDKVLSFTVVVVGAGMMVGPLFFIGNPNVVLLVFGAIAVLLGLRDLRLFAQPEKLRRSWLKIHLGKMTGAYIASVSAFLVVNEFFHPLVNWFLPTILGGVFIAYWIVKLNKNKRVFHKKPI